MNSTQIALLAALNSADFFKDSPIAKLFHEFAMGIYKDLKFQYLVSPLIENGYITNNGLITKKGRLSLIHDPREISDVQLSLNTGYHIKESLKRNSLQTRTVDNITVKGTLSYLPTAQFNQLLEACFHELMERSPNTDFGVTADVAEYIRYLNDVKEETELSVYQPEEVVNVATQEVVVPVVEVEKTKSKKAKTKV